MYATSDESRAVSVAADVVDLRSDTVTKPTDAMRAAMASAPVGDDVYGDDPTIIELEEKAADLLGKEAGLFMASGTQSNLIALLTHCGRGDEVISGNRYHIIAYEAGGASALGGIVTAQLPVNERFGLTAEAVEAAIKIDDAHYPITKLVSLENTVYGQVQDQAEIARISDVAKAAGLAVHLDGARIMNAAVKSNQAVSDLVAPMDTVSLCLSKGLGAPVGSVLVGPRDYIAKARRIRKMVGGGMRQAGVLAACGTYALDHHVERLAQDHARAERLADMLDKFDAIEIHRDRLETNMVFITVDEAHRDQLQNHLAEEGILFGSPSEVARLVTHLDIDDAALERVERAVASYFDA